MLDYHFVYIQRSISIIGFQKIILINSYILFTNHCYHINFVSQTSPVTLDGKSHSTVSRTPFHDNQHHHHHQLNHHEHHEHHHHQQEHQHHTDRKELLFIITEARAKLADTLHTEKKLILTSANPTDTISSSHGAGHGSGVGTTHSPSPTFFHNLLFRSNRASQQRATDQTHRAVERVFAARLLQQRHHLSASDFELNLVDAPLYDTPLAAGCADRTPSWPTGCPTLRYRSVDGSCNNAAHPRWGAAGAPMARLLAPAYEDGIWEPRWRSRVGGVLPNARTVSRQLFADIDRPHGMHNLLLMQFGQFLTHDITHSASITTDDGQAVGCCTADGAAVLPDDRRHWACLPIEIEGTDEFYGPFGQRCISMVRSALAVDDDDWGRCSLGYAKQLSKVSHYIDGSAVYGSDERTQEEVRSFRGGRLRVLDDFGRDLLPLVGAGAPACGTERGPCFMAGDGRSNQIVTLTALHTVWLRQHNRLADGLAALNEHWEDERVFQEARRIVVAQLQHIVYAEWLPYVIGEKRGWKVVEGKVIRVLEWM